MIKFLTAFFVALPEIMKLFQSMQKRIDAGEVDGTIKENAAKIRKTFEAKDAKALNDIFSGDAE